MVAFTSGQRPKSLTLKRTVESLKKTLDRRKAREAAQEAEKVKIKDEKDMASVQGAKDGGRMGYRMGGPKPLETKMDKKKADQTKNVKKLMTQPSAYDPEKRFIKGTRRRGDGGSTNFIKTTTDQTNLKEALKKAKKDNPGFNVRIMKPEDMSRRKEKKLWVVE